MDPRPEQLPAPTTAGLTGDEALVDAAQGATLEAPPAVGEVEPEDPALDDEVAAQEVPS